MAALANPAVVTVPPTVLVVSSEVLASRLTSLRSAAPGKYPLYAAVVCAEAGGAGSPVTMESKMAASHSYFRKKAVMYAASNPLCCADVSRPLPVALVPQ
jgi:hypothetical protein